MMKAVLGRERNGERDTRSFVNITSGDNFEEMTGMSRKDVVERILIGEEEDAKDNWYWEDWDDPITQQKYRKYIDIERKNLQDALNFLDFYVRFANNRTSSEEVTKYSDQIAELLDKFIEEQKDPTLSADFDKTKMEKLNESLHLLRSDNRFHKTWGLEIFVHFTHNTEPTIIPHIFGIQNIFVRCPLQSVILRVLDGLRDLEEVSFREYDNDREKYKWILDRNSEHKRKILKLKRKKVQEITKRHIFRKNVSG